MKHIRLVLLLCSFSLSAHAVDLSMPLDCEYGKKCFIERYFDHELKEEIYTDYTCGNLSSDEHHSTDFKLRNYAYMKEGISVLAAEDGVVKFVRDGMSDISIQLIGEEAVRGRECGNGIIIEHNRGYTTQYCHLKFGSITVKSGDEVEKGQPIGQVGLSGLTNFPFLEFSVHKEGIPVDPFVGEDPATGSSKIPCGSVDIYPLWDRKTERQLKYISTALLSSGFAKRVPHAEGAREGKFSRRSLKNTARFLVYWSDIFGISKGDTIRMSISSPDGTILVDEERKFNKSKLQHFQFVGKKPVGEVWPEGVYVGRTMLVRDEDVIFDQTFDLELIGTGTNAKAKAAERAIDDSFYESADEQAQEN